MSQTSRQRNVDPDQRPTHLADIRQKLPILRHLEDEICTVSSRPRCSDANLHRLVESLNVEKRRMIPG